MGMVPKIKWASTAIGKQKIKKEEKNNFLIEAPTTYVNQ